MAKRRRRRAAKVEKPTAGVTLNYRQSCQWLQQAHQTRTGGLVDAIKDKLDELEVLDRSNTLPVPAVVEPVTGNAAGVLRWVQALKDNATDHEKAQLVGLLSAVTNPGRTRPPRPKRTKK